MNKKELIEIYKKEFSISEDLIQKYYKYYLENKESIDEITCTKHDPFKSLLKNNPFSGDVAYLYHSSKKEIWLYYKYTQAWKTRNLRAVGFGNDPIPFFSRKIVWGEYLYSLYRATFLKYADWELFLSDELALLGEEHVRELAKFQNNFHLKNKIKDLDLFINQSHIKYSIEEKGQLCLF